MPDENARGVPRTGPWRCRVLASRRRVRACVSRRVVQGAGCATRHVGVVEERGTLGYLAVPEEDAAVRWLHGGSGERHSLSCFLKTKDRCASDDVRRLTVDQQ